MADDKHSRGSRDTPTHEAVAKAKRVALKAIAGYALTNDEKSEVADAAIGEASVKWDPARGAFSTLVHGIAWRMADKFSKRRARQRDFARLAAERSQTTTPHANVPGRRRSKGAAKALGATLDSFVQRQTAILERLSPGPQGAERCATWLRDSALPALQRELGSGLRLRVPADFDERFKCTVRRIAITVDGRWIERADTRVRRH
jgi:hypothetical protein